MGLAFGRLTFWGVPLPTNLFKSDHIFQKLALKWISQSEALLQWKANLQKVMKLEKLAHFQSELTFLVKRSPKNFWETFLLHFLIDMMVLVKII